MIFKKTFCVFTILLSFEANHFDEVCDWINAREGIKFEVDFVDLDQPWANAVDMNFGPRKDWSISGSKLALGSSCCADFWANSAVGDHFAARFANIWTVEVTFCQGFKSIHSGGVKSHLMMPFDKGMNHCLRWDNFPR